MKPKKSSQIGALVSGGLDSAVMLWRLADTYKKVVPIYIRCGLHWESAELKAIEKFIRKLTDSTIAPLVILDLPIEDAYGKHWSVSGKGIPGRSDPDEACFLPARNLLLITKASIYLSHRNISQVTLGNLATNPFPDSTKIYFENLGKILSQSLNAPFQIVSPLRRERKWELIRKSSHLPLHLTLSCANPVNFRHCGRCNKCAERQQAFEKAGIPDLTPYAS